MEYKGKLYGKVGNGYFPLLETTEDIEKLRRSVGRSGEDYLLEIDRKDKHIKQLQNEIEQLKMFGNNPDGTQFPGRWQND